MSRARNSADETLHIYAQYQWHSPARIVGSHDALKALGAAIEHALQKGSGVAKATCSDGEGYTIEVQISDANGIDKMPLPYTADCAADPRLDARIAMAADDADRKE